MYQIRSTTMRAAALATALGLLGVLTTACSGDEKAEPGDIAASAEGDAMEAASGPSRSAASKPVAAPVDFEGTMQQVVISVGSDAIRTLAGSTDLQTVLALSPDRVIKAVQDGEIQAQSITKASLEIDGRKGRYQDEDDPDYTILDGDQMASHVVMHENREIFTMKPGVLATDGDGADPLDLGAEKIGTSTIRGFDTTAYRFEFMDNIATVWLSEELDAQTGSFFNVWSALNPLGALMEVGKGAPVRTLMVSPETLAGTSSFMPAYTITEFYDLQPGDIAADRFGLPEDYRRVDMANMMGHQDD